LDRARLGIRKETDMNEQEQSSFDLTKTFVHLDAAGGVEREDVDAEFWARIAARPYHGMRLVAAIPHDADSPHWEMHPAGDELLYLLSGATAVVLAGGAGAERTVELRAGEAYVVPRGTWHRLAVRKPGVLLFITPGAGTEHRPR
jgi:mannose-6-phosphate isomerase-like protein (cupin superfamily)